MADAAASMEFRICRKLREVFFEVFAESLFFGLEIKKKCLKEHFLCFSFNVSSFFEN